VTANVDARAVSGSVVPIWRRAAARNIQANGDSVGSLGIDPRKADKIGRTMLFRRRLTEDNTGFVETGCIAAVLIATSAVAMVLATEGAGSVAAALSVVAVVAVLVVASGSVLACAATAAVVFLGLTVRSRFGGRVALWPPTLSRSSEAVDVCAPPELDTVTPGATSTVDDEDDDPVDCPS
jgi:hypothetical protein